jgi:Fur family transcriptional regulator, ferric uptake regulator
MSRASSVDQIILETLASEHVHLSAHQVYEKIRDRLPAVNPSTIYRALERLAKNGKISVSDMGTGAVVYESLSGEPHHHLVCQQCGHITTIDNSMVCQFFKSLEDRKNFKIATHHLVLFGLCADCQKANQD